MSHPPPSSEVTGRYRRPPALWLWLALLLIPLLLALLSWFLRGDDDQPAQAPPAAPPATTQPTGAATEEAQQGEPVSVSGDGETVTVAALVPDEQSRQDLLDTVSEGAGEAEVVDETEVADDIRVTDYAGLSALLSTVAGTYQDYDITVEDDAVTVTGTAPRSEDVEAAEEAAQSAFPGREVRTDLSAEAPVAGTTLSCGDLETQIQDSLEQNPVNFELESAAIDADSEERLTEIGTALVECNSTGIRVQGHADATGPEAINVPLSEERAEAVRDVLVEAGVDADEITAEGFAAEENVAPNTGPDVREENRRVEILIEGGGQ